MMGESFKGEDFSALKESENYNEADISIIKKLSSIDITLKNDREEAKVIDMID